jgi:hypothetical protein
MVVVTRLVRGRGSGGDAAGTRRWSPALVHTYPHAFVRACPRPCAPSFTSTPTRSFVPASVRACPRSHPPAFVPVSIGSRAHRSPFVSALPPAGTIHTHPCTFALVCACLPVRLVYSSTVHAHSAGLHTSCLCVCSCWSARALSLALALVLVFEGAGLGLKCSLLYI